MNDTDFSSTERDLRAALKTLPSASDEMQSCNAAVLILLLTDKATQTKEARILLTQRSAQLRTHGGEVAFPGGHRHREDKTLIDTALRETQEEVGIDKCGVEVVGCLPPRRTRSSQYVLPCVAILNDELTLNINNDEVAEVFQVPLNFFCQENLLAHKVNYRGRVYRIPRFKYQSYDIWGFTANIIAILCKEVFNQPLDVEALSPPQIEDYKAVG